MQSHVDLKLTKVRNAKISRMGSCQFLVDGFPIEIATAEMSKVIKIVIEQMTIAWTPLSSCVWSETKIWRNRDIKMGRDCKGCHSL